MELHMTALEFLYRIPRIPRRIEWLWDFYVRPQPTIMRLWLQNKFGTNAITQPGGPVVSLTTYGSRTSTVYLTIESIGRGRVLPSRVILWLDEKAVFDNLPKSIRRLQKRGLEVRLCHNYGPHKKYYPFIASELTFERPLVTADDDILYPESWLEELQRAYVMHPGAVSCFRSRVVSLDDSGFGRYADWEFCSSQVPSIRHFATGTSGVLYPPEFVSKLKSAGEGFLSCCPRADDVWLHANEVRSGFPVHQIFNAALHFIVIPGTETGCLAISNHLSGGNDEQIALTYTPQDREMLRASTIPQRSSRSLNLQSFTSRDLDAERMQRCRGHREEIPAVHG
jgi:hypothetical protein